MMEREKEYFKWLASANQSGKSLSFAIAATKAIEEKFGLDLTKLREEYLRLYDISQSDDHTEQTDEQT